MQRTSAIILSAYMLVLMACSNAGAGSNQVSEAQSGVQSEPVVKISTEFGDILIKLYNETPAHRDNFLKLASEGFYDGSLFHRVINQFMIQGGDPTSKDAVAGEAVGSGGPGYTLPAEIKPDLIHKKGAVAAARQGDQVNPERRSSGSQFYIVHGRVFNSQELQVLEQRMGAPLTEDQRRIYSTTGGAPHLDNAYTVFGEVISGLDVVDKIAAVQVGAADRPANNIPMKITLVK
jgi:cyclophilin family peptidyl-prolyl cis-trans isomerase